MRIGQDLSGIDIGEIRGLRGQPVDTRKVGRQQYPRFKALDNWRAAPRFSPQFRSLFHQPVQWERETKPTETDPQADPARHLTRLSARALSY